MKSINIPLRIGIVLFFLLYIAALPAETSAVLIDSIGKTENGTRFSPLFPYALYQSSVVELSENRNAAVASVPTYEESCEENKESPRLQSVLLNNDIFALYGKPNSKTMGILGQYSLDDIKPVMDDFVEKYDEANGRRGIIPAFYIIFGTCWPEGDIGILPDAVVCRYIEFAQEHGWYVFLDHQIGKYSVESAVKKLLPYLKYPNVHLALDPEWRTTKPMKEIGSVSAEEINTAQKMIQNYLIAHSLPGRRMLVIHQFKPKMISNRTAIKTNFELVQLIHCSDGFGSPELKKNTYAFNALAKNIPLKSFKLFLKSTVVGAGYDQPLMTPEEVMLLDPRPYLIMYQ